MVTLNSADNALKSFYLDAITETLNAKINPFLSKVEKTSKNVTGKDVRACISNGFNGGIASGSEDGSLPTAQNRTHRQIVAPLKNFYGTFEISDKAIRASANNEGAFVNLLNDEMKSLVESAKFNFGRMLFGDGSGRLGTILGNEDDGFKMDSVRNFAPDMVVDIVSDDVFIESVKIKAIDYANKIIYPTDERSEYNMQTQAGVFLHGMRNSDLTGLEAIFKSEDLYGLDKTEFGGVPYQKTVEGYISDNDLWDVVDGIEEASGKKVDMIICSWKGKRKLTEWFRDMAIPLPTITLENGDKAIDFYGIPVVVDKFCPEDTMYFLNTESFKLYQLCDWQWLETEDGKILKQIPGKPVYTATLVKYAELICENIAAQGVIRGIV